MIRGLLKGRAVAFCAIAAMSGLGSTADAAFIDSFSSGNDSGWSHYDPLASFGAGAAYSFPSGGYRIFAQPSPAPATLGPARGGSYRADTVYTDFEQSVDFVDWDNTHDQAFGLLARITSPGLGSLNGYAFTRAGGSIDLTRITGEVPTSLGLVSGLSWNTSHDYRLTFSGHGGVLTGKVYDLVDLQNPIATLSATDTTYASGYAGLVVFDNSNFPVEPTNTGDATFDNFSADVPEPTLTLLAGPIGLLLRLRRRPSIIA